MDILTAQRIVVHVSNLAALAAAFRAKFSRDFHISEDSPAAAWQLYRAIMAEQTRIAALLEPAALQSPYSRYGRWWERRDVIDGAMLNELGAEAMTLVERCAYLGAIQATTVNTPVLLIVQQSIAGMLHPTARLGALLDHPVPEAV